MKITYVVQGYNKQKSGKQTKLVADTPIQYKNEAEAVNRAERMSTKKVGVIAFAQEFDEATDEYGDTKILAKFGELPAGLADEE